MGKCFVTKLNGSVDNSALLKIGETKFKIGKEASKLSFYVQVAKPMVLTIEGNGYFTNSEYNENKGTSLSVSENTNQRCYLKVNGDVSISIPDKYNLSSLYAVDSSIVFDIDSLKYSKSLNSLHLEKATTCGDIASLKELTAIRDLYLGSNQLSGDIANLKNLTSMTFFAAAGTKISGDIAVFSNLQKLTDLNIANTQVVGDIASLKGLTSMKNLSIGSNQLSGDIANLKNLTSMTFFAAAGTKISGDIANLRNSKITECYLERLTLSGDLATIPSTCKFISLRYNDKSNFTWSSRASSSQILAMIGNPKIDNVDKMLQDQAQCVKGYKESDSYMFKTITATGKRTSASDAAVATLQQKGYTVSIVSV